MSARNDYIILAAIVLPGACGQELNEALDEIDNLRALLALRDGVPRYPRPLEWHDDSSTIKVAGDPGEGDAT